jgi:catechol 2,3-dioxygenase-like lactoylglutathione lyase family enzyme
LFPAPNPAKVKHFYADILGLPLIGEDRFAPVLVANGTMLRVAKVEKFTPAAIHNARLASAERSKSGFSHGEQGPPI